MLRVELSAEPNPDFGPNSYRGSVRLPRRSIKVNNLAEAVAVCRTYIEEHELGGGNWTGGRVTDGAGKEVARISYNGRIWEPGEYPTPEITGVRLTQKQ
jgi:hypothetical protein